MDCSAVYTPNSNTHLYNTFLFARLSGTHDLFLSTKQHNEWSKAQVALFSRWGDQLTKQGTIRSRNPEPGRAQPGYRLPIWPKDE